MTAHSELVARLEGASEGSRKLDVAVRDFLLPDETALDFTMKIGFADQPWTHGERRIFVVENYTTSLDAALALAERVLPGVVFWNLEHNAIINLVPIYRAEVSGERDGCAGEGEAPTPALALCAAILRATATGPQPSDDGEKT